MVVDGHKSKEGEKKIQNLSRLKLPELIKLGAKFMWRFPPLGLTSTGITR